MSNDILQAIGRLRRAQPRNPDTMLVCDELERRLAAPLMKINVEPDGSTQTEIIDENCPVCESRRATVRNRVKRYRTRRAEKKAPPA
jgi:hypothetical protein